VKAFWGQIAILIPALMVFYTAVAGQTQLEKPVVSEESDCEGAEAALDVTSEQMTFDRDTHTFIFEDKVRVQRCDLVIDCDHLQVVRYADENRIKHVIATGNVRFRDGTRHAIAERADYYEAEQKLVLVGNPRAWDADKQNELSGDEIIVFLEEERILVSGARVRFHPNRSSGSAP
jgi:lipopolysaccharide transport protein LptA